MKWFALILAVPFLLITGGLLLNRPPLLSPPGPLERIKTYLTTNVATTRLDHRFPELRSPLVPLDTQQTQGAVFASMRSLGWSEISVVDGRTVAVVVSPLFGFRDDLSVWLEKAGSATLLHARSSSRIGKGDLAANTRHLRRLFAEVKRRVDAPSEFVPGT